MIDFYLLQDKNRSIPLKHFQLAERILKRWIKQFHHNGINGLLVLGKKPKVLP